MKENSERSSQPSVINAFSIDVEGFVESNKQSFYIPDGYINQSLEDNEIDRNTNVLLEILDDFNVKATFFFIGRLARDIPGLVKKVAEAGHEIACHSYAHIRVCEVNKEEFKEKISAAKRRLEDVSGQNVVGFRAPDFSITKSSIWALDILKETGFVYDSSIYPFGLHDVYGIKDAEPTIHKLPNELVEFPLSTITLFGKNLPFGGGGYFRLYPLWLTKYFIDTINKRGLPFIFYIHPYEVGPVIPKIQELSAYRKFRHYYHCKSGNKRLRNILHTSRFKPIITLLKDKNLLKG